MKEYSEGRRLGGFCRSSFQWGRVQGEGVGLRELKVVKEGCKNRGLAVRAWEA